MNLLKTNNRLSDLFLHHNEIKTVFDLLGNKENDITYSVGWALARSESFLGQVLEDLFPSFDYGSIKAIKLQEFKFGTGKRKNDKGYTDIEIETERLQIIIEAKRGWILPSEEQLNKYAEHLKQHHGVKKAILVMSECSYEYAKNRLPNSIKKIPLLYRSWKQLRGTVMKSENGSSHADKRILRELKKYLEGLMSLQNQESNLVYVVSLGSNTPEWSQLSWIEIVTEKGRYFHPYGSGGWPKDPPNYLGFRYKGKLQSIHHIEDYKIVENLSLHIPEISRRKWQATHDNFPLVLYRLGKPIIPSRDVRMGKIFRNGRVRAALDLLLTCKTISEARDKTKKRLGKEVM